MKVFCPAIQKGGTGKSALACQFAFYAHEKRGLRVLVLDFDHQCNATSVLKESGLAQVSSRTTGQLFDERTAEIEQAPFLVVPGDKTILTTLERQPERRNEFATNLRAFVNAVDDQFDVCVIDINPSPDIRHLSALVVSDYVVGVIQLMQESIDGIADLLNHPSLGVRKIQATVNPDLTFLGLLPNMVKGTPFQKENLKDVVRLYRDLLIPLGENIAYIRDTTAIAEAQSEGAPVWSSKKTSARDAWTQIEPVFRTLTEQMGL